MADTPETTVTPPTPPKDSENGGLFILGQTIVLPRTVWGAVTAVGFFVATVFAIYYIVHADVKTLRQIGISFFHVTPGGEPEKDSDIISYSFWTPSKDTADELQKALGDQTAGNGSWLLEKVTDDKLAEFGQKLHNEADVEAYRRAPIYGQGRKFSDAKTPLTSGWWWTLRAKKGFTIEKLSKIYHDEWGNKSSLYIEVFDPSGTFK